MKQQTKTILAGIVAGMVFLTLIGFVFLLIYMSGGLTGLIISVVMLVVITGGALCLVYFVDHSLYP
jgi:hypothetical protein